MKQYICDNCGRTFGGPLDEEKHQDEHGVWHVFDLCAPCRKKMSEEVKKSKGAFFDKILKKA